MKINLKKLEKLERKYNESNISINVIHSMMNVVLETKVMEQKDDLGYKLSLTTLQELGVIENE